MAKPNVWEQLVEVQEILHAPGRVPREACYEASAKLDRALIELHRVVDGDPLTNKLLAALRRANITATPGVG